MVIFGFDPLETEIVLQCWSVSYRISTLHALNQIQYNALSCNSIRYKTVILRNTMLVKLVPFWFTYLIKAIQYKIIIVWNQDIIDLGAIISYAFKNQ